MLFRHTIYGACGRTAVIPITGAGVAQVGMATTPRNRRFAVPKPVEVRDFSPKHPDWLWGKAAEA